MVENRKANVPPPPRRGILAPVPTLNDEPPVVTPAPAVESQSVPAQPPAEPVRRVSPPPNNMATPNSGLQDMNFKVDPEFHRAFKIVSTMKGMSMKELLEASFRAWVDTYGDDTIKMLLPKL